LIAGGAIIFDANGNSNELCDIGYMSKNRSDILLKTLLHLYRITIVLMQPVYIIS